MKNKIFLLVIISFTFKSVHSQSIFPTNGSNVGIGTTTPIYKLSLGGTTQPNKIGMGSVTNQTQVLFLPDQSIYPGSIAFGNGLANSTGTYNTAIGLYSLFNNTSGTLNTAVGYYTLASNTIGTNNVAVGQASLSGNTIGSYNTGLGYQSLFYNTLGNYNTGIGFQSLLNNISGLNNVAIGTNSLLSNTNNFNTAVGNGALSANIAGSNNTAIGNGANVSSGSLTYATAIGAGASVSQSNSIVLGGTDIKVGIGINSPSSRLEINNITLNTSGLKFTQLTSAFNPTVTSDKSLSVDNSGAVIAVKNRWATASFGTDNIINTNGGVIIIGSGFNDISKIPGSYKLFVSGGILTEKVRVAVPFSVNWADFVFAKNYNLKKLSEVEDYINKNKHLPGVPSANDLVKDGIDVNQMFAKQMEKIEELTLYIIDLNKKIINLENQVIEFKNK